MPADNLKTLVMYEQKGWAGTIHWVLLLYRGTVSCAEQCVRQDHLFGTQCFKTWHYSCYKH